MSSDVKVLIVQHAEPETPGLILETLRDFQLATDTVRSDLHPLPENVARYSGLVLMGGPQSVYDARYPFLLEEMHLVKSAIELGIPVLGVCLGCQILAECLGGSVKPGKSPEIGWYEVRKSESADDEPLFREFPASFVPLHWHGDVIEVPPGCVELGSSDLSPAQGFSFKGQCYGLLFHVEMTEQMVEGMCAAFPSELAQAGVTPADILSMSAPRLRAINPFARAFYGEWARLVQARFKAS